MVRIEHRPDSRIATRDRQAGISRPAGLLITAATAALVFVVGRALLPLPHANRTAPEPTTPVLPAPVDAASTDSGGMDGLALDGSGEAGSGRIDADQRAPARKASTEEAAARPADDNQADKDIARIAWRANWPEIRVVGTHASIFIPVKGSVEGGSYAYLAKSRVVAISLPHAASLNTMHYYRLAKDGFRNLWTFQDENNALPERGTKLRLGLDEKVGPVVELHDDYIKVTIPRPKAE